VVQAPRGLICGRPAGAFRHAYKVARPGIGLRALMNQSDGVVLHVQDDTNVQDDAITFTHHFFRLVPIGTSAVGLKSCIFILVLSTCLAAVTASSIGGMKAGNGRCIEADLVLHACRCTGQQVRCGGQVFAR